MRWIQVSYTPGLNLDAGPDSWVAVVFDVDERRRTEDALKTAIANADAARREAVAGARARDEFLAMLSHELRNPLGAIQNALSVSRLAGPAQAQAAGRALDVMNRQVNRMTQLVDDLLETSRVIAGKIHLVLEPLDLGACVERIFGSVSETRFQDRRVVVSCEPVWISGDAMRVEQVVANLLFNALKFTPPDGTVQVRVTAEGDFAVLEVSDNGVGIEPEMLERIFDLFVQGDTSLDRSKSGLGVGLTLVRKMVELHGGTVRAFSAGKGRGSSFTIRLPRIDAPAPLLQADPPAQTKNPALRILVIEDNADSREMLGILLRAEGHEVSEAADGPSALRAVRDFQPDTAIVDVGLPEMDGYEVARQIRAMNGRRIRLVAVTGYGGPDDRHRAKQAGFDLHVTKPVDPSKLIELIVSAAAGIAD
jgi:signal transduction histidine kinase/ActR/RegA family two-component response regulator